MLFILIPIAWLAVLSLLAAVCRVAANGDSREVRPAGSHAELIGVRIVLAPDSSPTRSALALRREGHGEGTRNRPAIRRRRIAVHGLHGR